MFTKDELLSLLDAKKKLLKRTYYCKNKEIYDKTRRDSPVDDRRFTDQLCQFVKKNGPMWSVTCDA